MDEEDLAGKISDKSAPLRSVHPNRNRAVVTHAATEVQNVRS